jgi:hypothetical protein
MEQEDYLFTGESPNSPEKMINVEFDKYIITVVLDNTDRFLGISKIQINKKFVDYKTKLKGVHEVEQFYHEM